MVQIFSEGNDTANFFSEPDTIFGLGGNDYFATNPKGGSVLYGNRGVDTLIAVGPGDYVFGGQDNDNIQSARTGAGKTYLYGDNGNDTIFGFLADTIAGGNGDDSIFSGIGGVSLIFGNAGKDTIFANGAGDSAYGGKDNDYMTAGSVGNIIISGDLGDDTLITQGGSSVQNYLFGGGGNDTITGDGNDFLYGNAGNDTINSGLNDVVYAGQNNDYIFGDAILISGDLGDDTIIGNTTGVGTTSLLLGGLGDDSVVGAGVLYGNGGNDILIGKDTNTILFGGQGNDYLSGSVLEFYGDKGNDSLLITTGDFADGGEGDDTINASDLSTAITIFGGVNNDIIYGGKEADSLYGDDGDDLIIPLGQNADTITGGQGADTFLFGGTTSTFIGAGQTTLNADIINDFQTGVDKLALSSNFLSNSTFTFVSTPGSLPIGGNFAGTKASPGQILFDSNSGLVAFNGGIFLRLNSGATLDAADIVFF